MNKKKKRLKEFSLELIFIYYQLWDDYSFLEYSMNHYFYLWGFTYKHTTNSRALEKKKTKAIGLCFIAIFPCEILFKKSNETSTF